jgi:hypothetical protein
VGIVSKEAGSRSDDDRVFDKDLCFDLSFKGGLMFTTSLVPGLYLQAAYQYNFYLDISDRFDDANPSVLFFGIGYGF